MSDGEKPHAPTQKKIEDARKKGDIPLSTDLLTAAAMGGFALVAAGFGAQALPQFGEVLRGFLIRPDDLARAVGEGGGEGLLAPLLGDILGQLLPWFLLPAALVVLALLAQQAPAFAGSKLAPKLSRISPLSNAKQKFGKHGLVEFFKACAKLSLHGAVVGYYLWTQRDRLLALLLLAPQGGMAILGGILVAVILRIAVVALVIGLANLLWQRLSHHQKLLMSHQEIREEHKESEGDPALKQQRRARAVAIATNPLRQAMAGADVVIVNPTHFAVALAWDRKGTRPPHCVAKGTDEMAATIRKLAQENGVPIHSDPPTARALYAGLAVGQDIDRAHFPAVAAAIRFADLMRKKAAK